MFVACGCPVGLSGGGEEMRRDGGLEAGGGAARGKEDIHDVSFDSLVAKLASRNPNWHSYIAMKVKWPTGQPRLVSRPQLEQVLEAQEKTAVKMVGWKERRPLR